VASPSQGPRGQGDDVDETPEAASEAASEAQGNDHRGNGGGDAGVTSGQAQPEAPTTLLVVDQTAPKRSHHKRGGARPGAGRKPVAGNSKPSAPKPPPSGHIKDIGVGREAAAALLAITEGGLMMAIGPRAAMLPEERGKIEPPLGRILARMSPQAATLVASFADPLMLGVAVVAYVSRITREDAPKPRPGAPTAPNVVKLTPDPSRLSQAPVAPSTNGTGAPTIVAPPDNRDAGLFAE